MQVLSKNVILIFDNPKTMKEDTTENWCNFNVLKKTGSYIRTTCFDD
jgi:hypothetical protein